MNKLRGKRLLFVGDSLQRSQWESFVCLVESVIPEGEKSMNLGQKYFVFKAKVRPSVTSVNLIRSDITNVPCVASKAYNLNFLYFFCLFYRNTMRV